MHEIRIYATRETAFRENCLCFVDESFKSSTVSAKAGAKCDTWVRAYCGAVSNELRGAKLTEREKLERRAGLLVESIRAYFPEGGRFGFAEPFAASDRAMLRRASEMLQSSATAVAASGLVA